jgi:hypothetical protein
MYLHLRPIPITPKLIFSPGGVLPSNPSAAAGMIVGTAKTRDALAVAETKLRRLIGVSVDMVKKRLSKSKTDIQTSIILAKDQLGSECREALVGCVSLVVSTPRGSALRYNKCWQLQCASRAAF